MTGHVGRLANMVLIGTFLFSGLVGVLAQADDVNLEFLREWYVEGEPHLIAVDPVSGSVFVSITNNHRILWYGAGGELRGLLGREGEIPAGLAVDVEGLVVVAVNINNNYRVVRYHPSGQVAAEWAGEGSVGGIAASPDGFIWVVVNINNNWHVVRYGREGEFYPDLADEWARPLGGPVAIACDPAGGAVVAVNINNNWRLFRRGPEGQPLAEWEVVAGVIETNGITVGPNGTIFVNINQNHRVTLYNMGGEYIGSFGGAGTGPGQFLSPTALAATREGLLYVADAGTQRIQVFRL
jgi:DNA-binding beta-propeller fold protein YncE